MNVEVIDYESAFDWVSSTGAKSPPHLLLGNGFSVAYDRNRFSYSALLDSARAEGHLSSLSDKFFITLETYDFENVIRQIMGAATALEVLEANNYRSEIKALREEAEALKELLAKSLAALHPERPGEVTDEAYRRVKTFINRHGKVYTTNYDLLLYWTIMQDYETGDFKASDDGFRGTREETEYVVWNHLDPHTQSVHYLHGALHLYRDIESAQLQKLTWVRTDVALIDQIREQLHNNRFPLMVAEGTSQEKLAKIQTSDYLSKGLRSLAQVRGGLLVHGLSFSENDAHVYEALVNSKLARIAVSLYGPLSSDGNRATIRAVNRLIADRDAKTEKYPLEVAYYDAMSVELW